MKKGANNTYWGNIREGIKSSLQGLHLTFKHIRQAKDSRKPIYVDDKQYFEQETGIVTLQYPYEAIPVPDNGRYRLHNEMDDCIVCDKCAKVCPVNCIDIEPIKAVGEVGKTSDGSSIRLYAAKFDIDMAKCCFCGLCTTVCPTECLTMTKAYDFSEFDIEHMNYHYANLSPDEAAEKRRLLEEFQKEKLAAKPPVAKPKPATEVPIEAKSTTDANQANAVIPTDAAAEEVPVPAVKRPVFRPGAKPKPATEATDEVKPAIEENKPIIDNAPVDLPTDAATEEVSKPIAKRPVFRPGAKKPNPESE
ncbi:MAG: 4Fe-4S binding protein [Bacteroidota bacterium]